MSDALAVLWGYAADWYVWLVLGASCFGIGLTVHEIRLMKRHSDNHPK